MLTDQEFTQFEKHVTEKRLNKAQIINYLKEHFVFNNNTTIGSGSLSRADKHCCVSRVKADPDAGLSATEIAMRKKGVRIGTEKDSAKVDDRRRK